MPLKNRPTEDSPLSVSAAPSAGLEAVAYPKAEETREEFHNPDQIRILILDDDAAICRLVKLALKPSGFTVETLSLPHEMEAKLASATYHLVVLDYIIPGLVPEKLFAAVQRHQPEASVIVVTAYPSVDSALQCLRARIHDYIPKPFNIEHLEQTILRCLESRGLLRLSNEALRETLGAAIRDRRKAAGLTLADLARRIHLSTGYVSQIELGKNSASIETLYRIALTLNVPLAELFRDIHPKM